MNTSTMSKAQKNETIDRIIRTPDAARMLGVTPNTMRVWEKAGRIPRARRLSPKVVGWTKSDLDAVMTTAQRVVANVAAVA